jgi:PhzF family phenazine biosynthesis protein
VPPADTMRIPIYQVDAFACEPSRDKPFSGNPAAVCPLENWLKDETLQAIAAENNLSETAYYVLEEGCYRLRWFTPAVEVDLCGHATLAAAHVILKLRGEIGELKVIFDSRSGELTVAREDDLYVLDFPSRYPLECAENPVLFEALGARPAAFLRTGDCFCVFENEDQVRSLAPDMGKLARVDCRGTIATAPGKDCDFVSRFFAPRAGIPEDPVTGSAYEPDPLLVPSAGQEEAVCAANFPARRRIMVRGPWRSRGDWRAGCRIPGGADHNPNQMSVTTFRSGASERL